MCGSGMGPSPQPRARGPMPVHLGGAFFPAASAPPCVPHWAAVVQRDLLPRRAPANCMDSESASAHALEAAESCFLSCFPQIVTNAAKEAFSGAA